MAEYRGGKPPLGSLEINVDAASFNEASTHSFAGIARDHEWAFVEGFSVCRTGVVSPELGEVMGVWEALSWIKRRKWVQIVIETNSLLVVQALRSSLSIDSYFGWIIDEGKVLWKDLIFVLIIFVKHYANGTAHALTKTSSIVTESILLKENISSNVLDVMLKDCC